jgi:hypothetical protein
MEVYRIEIKITRKTIQNEFGQAPNQTAPNSALFIWGSQGVKKRKASESQARKIMTQKQVNRDKWRYLGLRVETPLKWQNPR